MKTQRGIIARRLCTTKPEIMNPRRITATPHKVTYITRRIMQPRRQSRTQKITATRLAPLPFKADSARFTGRPTNWILSRTPRFTAGDFAVAGGA
jgi:hypothetical protein